MLKSNSTPRPLEVVSCFSILGKLIDLNLPGVDLYSSKEQSNREIFVEKSTKCKISVGTPYLHGTL